jgi:hypothetical protein
LNRPQGPLKTERALPIECRMPKGLLSRFAAVAAAACFCGAAAAPAAVTQNLTGLPTYPHLTGAVMDDVWHTENLGRWCARFTGVTSDGLDAVEDWYRRTLRHASETDLTRDRRFQGSPELAGVKLALGVDYVALYRMPHQPTVIELHLCRDTP